MLPRVLLRVLPVAALAMLIIGLVTKMKVEHSFLQQMQSNLEQDAEFGAHATAAKLNAVLQAARSVAANDLVINGLVDMEAREVHIPLYFNQLQVAGLGSGEKISFADYRGRRIASNALNGNFVGAPWLKKLMEEKKDYVRIDTRGATLAVPVVYQGFAEGMIVVELGKPELSKLLSISLGTHAVLIRDEAGEVFASDLSFARRYERDAKEISGWVLSTAEIPGYDLTIVVAESKASALAPINALERSLYFALLLALAALAAGTFFVAYLTTRPLSKFTMELRKISEARDLDRRLPAEGAAELRELAEAFNAMLDRLKKTVVSHEQLAVENEHRMRAEHELRDQNERFNVALQNMSHGVCVFDRENRLIVFNERYATLYGLSPDAITQGMTIEQIVERRIANGIYADGNPQAYLDDRLTWGNRKHGDTSVTHELTDGRFIRISRQALSNGGWVTTHEDITEAKRMERVKNEFVSVVSHELRTPLTSLSGSLLLLNSNEIGDLPDEAKSLLDVAIRNSKRLAILVDDILDVEKIRSNKLEFAFAVEDVVAVARDAITDNAAYAAEHNVRFELQGCLGTAHARIDPNRLTQVFANLLSNAAKFSPPNSRVVVRIARSDGLLRCAVIDKGCGIPPAKRSELFERFVQIDASDSRARRGTGLGLSIVKAIVEKHGSEIHVESEVGKGSTFYFDLEEVEVPSDVANNAAVPVAASSMS
ncbi:MAG: PAS-domain containing protein [Hyphomicrobiaceae bacterium]|nr:PAS-domain containing protein [Hyphomicrobiaceae bacterium]